MHAAAMMAAAGPGQTFVVQCLGFAVLAFVLVKLVFPQLGKILGARTKGIEETFQKIETDTAETSKRLSEIKAKLDQVTQESQQRLQAALDDARKSCDQILADANAQVQAAMDKAKREIEIERDKAVLELRQEATSLTLMAAEHLVQSVMSDPIHENLVTQYLTQLDGVKRS